MGIKDGVESTSPSTGNGHNGWKDKQNRPCDESRQPLPNKRPPGRCVWTLFSLIVLEKTIWAVDFLDVVASSHHYTETWGEKHGYWKRAPSSNLGCCFQNGAAEAFDPTFKLMLAKTANILALFLRLVWKHFLEEGAWTLYEYNFH